MPASVLELSAAVAASEARGDFADPFVLVELLAHDSRHRMAFNALKAQGPDATAAVVAGLDHPSADVRRACCQLFDRLADTTTADRFFVLLEDPDPFVRVHALHGIACDRCKPGECRIDRGAILDRALEILVGDPSWQVRGMASEVVGKAAHDDQRAVVALERAHREDPHPMVRKKAAWYAPGGSVHRKTAPKPRR